MIELLSFIQLLISVFIWLLLLYVILGWLVGLGIVNGANPHVRQIVMGLRAVMEPLCGPIRRRLPNTSGLDFSPIVLWLICMGISSVVIENLKKMF